MAGFVEGIYLAPEGGTRMKGVQAARVLEGCGLEGDRYCAGTGHWSRFGRACELTLIAAEDLDDIERETGVVVKNGRWQRDTNRVNSSATVGTEPDGMKRHALDTNPRAYAGLAHT